MKINELSLYHKKGFLPWAIRRLPLMEHDLITLSGASKFIPFYLYSAYVSLVCEFTDEMELPPKTFIIPSSTIRNHQIWLISISIWSNKSTVINGTDNPFEPHGFIPVFLCWFLCAQSLFWLSRDLCSVVCLFLVFVLVMVLWFFSSLSYSPLVSRDVAFNEFLLSYLNWNYL